MNRFFRPGGQQSRRGLSLIETVVAVGVSTFVFSFAAYLLFMVAKNAKNVHEQVISQNSAASAGEKAATVMRKASRYRPWTGDADSPTSLTRLIIEVPGPNNTVRQSAFCFHPTNDARHPERGRIEYYEDASRLSFGTETRPVKTLGGTVINCPVPTSTSTPTESWAGQTAFFVSYENRYRVTLHLEYSYYGFGLSGVAADNQQKGQFVTDIIARNHNLDKGSTDDNYAEYQTTSTPALLY